VRVTGGCKMMSKRQMEGVGDQCIRARLPMVPSQLVEVALIKVLIKATIRSMAEVGSTEDTQGAGSVHTPEATDTLGQESMDFLVVVEADMAAKFRLHHPSRQLHLK
jgi:hypothetical protein